MSSDQNNLPVALDVMGGDFGPEVIVRGALDYIKETNSPVILVGDAKLIQAELGLHKSIPTELVSVEDVPDYVRMDDSPSKAIRSKNIVSVRRIFELVKEGKASSVVSPGNTGAMLASGIFVLGVIAGITRPAIATVIPRKNNSTPTVLLDSGANVQCTAEQFAQFAIMGKFYSRALFGIKEPKIGVISNGTESSKGNDLARAAAYIISNIKELNYVGYVEGRCIPTERADVVVCDGFVGNVILKTMEGSVDLVVSSIKEQASSLSSKLGLLLAKSDLKALFEQKLDPANYGGAPLLGLNGIGIVCHGSSKEKAIRNALKVAKKLDQANIVSKMGEELASIGASVEDMQYHQ